MHVRRLGYRRIRRGRRRVQLTLSPLLPSHPNIGAAWGAYRARELLSELHNLRLPGIRPARAGTNVASGSLSRAKYRLLNAGYVILRTFKRAWTREPDLCVVRKATRVNVRHPAPARTYVLWNFPLPQLRTSQMDPVRGQAGHRAADRVGTIGSACPVSGRTKLGRFGRHRDVQLPFLRPDSMAGDTRHRRRGPTPSNSR
jgi:hypothetical protein